MSAEGARFPSDELTLADAATPAMTATVILLGVTFLGTAEHSVRVPAVGLVIAQVQSGSFHDFVPLRGTIVRASSSRCCSVRPENSCTVPSSSAMSKVVRGSRGRGARATAET